MAEVISPGYILESLGESHKYAQAGPSRPIEPEPQQWAARDTWYLFLLFLYDSNLSHG